MVRAGSRSERGSPTPITKFRCHFSVGVLFSANITRPHNIVLCIFVCLVACRTSLYLYVIYFTAL